ncbi:MAG: R3H domain-containing nucleic acid-binding protein [Patescibacteria group bacterium]
MDKLQEKIKTMIGLMGFDDFSVNCDAGENKISVFINDELVEKFLPGFVENFDHLVKLMIKKEEISTIFVDVNNYRRKREGLIVELAKASARKSLAEKKEVSLPAMNAYERRLVHLELAPNPDIKTESMGDGKERHIIIRPIN